MRSSLLSFCQGADLRARFSSCCLEVGAQFTPCVCKLQEQETFGLTAQRRQLKLTTASLYALQCGAASYPRQELAGKILCTGEVVVVVR